MDVSIFPREVMDFFYNFLRQIKGDRNKNEHKVIQAATLMLVDLSPFWDISYSRWLSGSKHSSVCVVVISFRSEWTSCSWWWNLRSRRTPKMIWVPAKVEEEARSRNWITSFCFGHSWRKIMFIMIIITFQIMANSCPLHYSWWHLGSIRVFQGCFFSSFPSFFPIYLKQH